jgi:hypothetical protein
MESDLQPYGFQHLLTIMGMALVVGAVAMAARQPGLKKVWELLNEMASEYNNQYIDNEDVDVADDDRDKTD